MNDLVLSTLGFVQYLLTSKSTSSLLISSVAVLRRSNSTCNKWWAKINSTDEQPSDKDKIKVILKYYRQILLHIVTGDSKIKLFSLLMAADINVTYLVNIVPLVYSKLELKCDLYTWIHFITTFIYIRNIGRNTRLGFSCHC
jgi:hypothetical protein